MKNIFKSIIIVLFIFVGFNQTKIVAQVTPNDYTFVDREIWLQTWYNIKTSDVDYPCGNKFDLDYEIDISCGFTGTNSNAHFISLDGGYIEVNLINVSNNTSYEIFSGNPGEGTVAHIDYIFDVPSDALGYKISFKYYYRPNSDWASETYYVVTPVFHVGNSPEIIFPENTSVGVDVNPTFQWDDIDNSDEYWVVLVNTDAQPSWPGISCSTGSTNGADLTKKGLTDAFFSPASEAYTLDYDTNYKLIIMSSQNGKYYFSQSVFTTRSEGVLFNELNFYDNVTANTSNPNNYINTGVPIRFKTSVQNELAQNLATLSGTITCSTPGVTITDNNVNFNNLASGAIGWSSDEFEILVDNSVSAGTLLEFELTTNDEIATGDPWVSSFSFPVSPLENGIIVLDDDNNPDSNGDNDDIPEPGETIEVLPTLNNISDFVIAEVQGTLSCEQDFINIWNGTNGASGYVYNTWDYNLISNVQTPIDPGAVNVMPEFDYVFDYPVSNPLQELNFNMLIEGKLNDNTGTLMKWKTSFVYNEGIEGPPVIISTMPTDNSVDISVGTNLEITFDKTVTAVSSKYIYLYEDGGSVLNTIEATDAQVTINNDIVTINPTVDLTGGTNYYIIIDAGAFKDNSNNDFGGINTPEVWNFTTILSNPPDAPTNIIATAISYSEIELNWDAVSSADTYQVMSCDESVTYISSTTFTSFSVSGLEESTTYDFIVKATNTVGTSDASSCEEATTFCMHTWGEPVIYTNSTTAYGIVTIEGEPASEHDIIGVFVDNECRGVSEVVIYEGTAYVTINIQGEEVEALVFKIWDSSECLALSVNLDVNSNPGGNLGYPPNYLPIATDGCEYIPVSDFSYTINGLTITFFNSSQNADTYNWNFGDTNTSTEENPVHTYASASIYDVVLTAINDGCEDATTQTIDITSSIIKIDSDRFVKISPNPTNGIIIIETENINNAKMQIEVTNINGQVVYKNLLNSLSNKEIDLSEHASGIYFVTFKTNDFIKTMKLIKK